MSHNSIYHLMSLSCKCNHNQTGLKAKENKKLSSKFDSLLSDIQNIPNATEITTNIDSTNNNNNNNNTCCHKQDNMLETIEKEKEIIEQLKKDPSSEHFMPAQTFYRRELPCPPAIAFGSEKGKQIFADALQQG